MNSRRKLTLAGQSAINVLYRHQPYCPGSASGVAVQMLREALDELVRKKYATAEVGDDGPVYSLTALGLGEASYGP